MGCSYHGVNAKWEESLIYAFLGRENTSHHVIVLFFFVLTVILSYQNVGLGLTFLRAV